jgi:hypothetical protein
MRLRPMTNAKSLCGALLCVCLTLASISIAGSHKAQSSITINFDEPDASQGRLIANDYLAKYGITISESTNGTLVAIVNASQMYQGRALIATSPPNVLTQVNSNDPVSFTLNFPKQFRLVRFSRPALTAGVTGVTFPEWRAQALDAKGGILDEVGEPLGAGPRYYSNIPARTFTLKGPGIKAVRFNSKNYHFAGFSAVVIDDLTLISDGVAP